MEKKLNILQRLNAVMGEVDYIQKEKKNGMNYSIVSHDAVTAKVRPFLVKHGVVYYPFKVARSQNGNRTEMDVIVRFVSIDDKEDFVDVETCGYGIDTQDKGPGKSMSYAVKYALLKALGLETGDDPDADQETPHVPEKKNPGAVEWPAEHPITQEEAKKLYGEVLEALEMVEDKESLDSWQKQYGDRVKTLLSSYQRNAVVKKFKEAQAHIGNRAMDNGQYLNG